jgi:Tfp pilus assembly pilus retraction ATPase PilT
MELLELLEAMVELKAPDLILKVGAKPTVRVRGGLAQINEGEVTRDFALRVVASLLDDRRMETFVRGSEVDLAYEVAGLARFRVNVFAARSRASPSSTCRRSSSPSSRRCGAASSSPPASPARASRRRSPR